jgi:hypothetical protein
MSCISDFINNNKVSRDTRELTDADIFKLIKGEKSNSKISEINLKDNIVKYLQKNREIVYLINKYIYELIDEKMNLIQSSLDDINICNLIIKYEKKNFIKLKKMFLKDDIKKEFKFSFMEKKRFVSKKECFENTWRCRYLKKIKIHNMLTKNTKISIEICKLIKNIINKENSEEVKKIKKCIIDLFKLKSINAFIEYLLLRHIKNSNFDLDIIKNHCWGTNFPEFFSMYYEIEQKIKSKEYFKEYFNFEMKDILSLGVFYWFRGFNKYFSNELSDSCKDIIKNNFDILYQKTFNDLNINTYDIEINFLINFVKTKTINKLEKYWILDKKNIYASFLVVGREKTGKSNIVNTLLEYFKTLDSNINFFDDEEINRNVVVFESLKTVIDERTVKGNENIYEQIPNYESYDNIIITFNSLFALNDNDKFLIDSFLNNKKTFNKVILLFTFNDLIFKRDNLIVKSKFKVKKILENRTNFQNLNFIFSGGNILNDCSKFKISGITNNWLNDLVNKIVQTNDSNLFKIIIERLINKN